VEETFSGKLYTYIMEERKRELHHNYAQDNRLAEIYLTEDGWEVDLLEDDMFIETRKVYAFSESYAEDVADNWCQGIIKIGNNGHKGYYGYNTKTENYYPEIDD